MKRYLLIIVAVVMCGMSYGQDFDQYLRRVYRNVQGDTLNYRMLLPKDYDSTKTYPLILFMHGMGEWGSDNQTQLVHGGAMFLEPAFRDKYEAIVLFPQTPKNVPWMHKEWTSNSDGKGLHWGFSANPKPSPTLLSVVDLVHKCIADMPVDATRVYVMGLSMGGMGTFDIVCRNPKLFAAAIPICGGVHPKRLTKKLQGVKFRIYHGDNDTAVNVDYSRKAYKALHKAGVDVEYIEFPGVNHGSWGPAFAQPDYFEWLFKQHR